MGGILSIVRDSKIILSELKDILKVTLKMIVAITNIIQDVEVISDELRDVVRLMELEAVSQHGKESKRLQGTLLNDIIDKINVIDHNRNRKQRKIIDIKRKLERLSEAIKIPVHVNDGMGGNMSEPEDGQQQPTAKGKNTFSRLKKIWSSRKSQNTKNHDDTALHHVKSTPESNGRNKNRREVSTSVTTVSPNTTLQGMKLEMLMEAVAKRNKVSYEQQITNGSQLNSLKRDDLMQICKSLSALLEHRPTATLSILSKPEDHACDHPERHLVWPIRYEFELAFVVINRTVIVMDPYTKRMLRVVSSVLRKGGRGSHSIHRFWRKVIKYGLITPKLAFRFGKLFKQHERILAIYY